MKARKTLGVLFTSALLCVAGLLLPGQVVHAESVEINSTNFPDEQFRNFVRERYDNDKNGMLSDTELSFATTIKCDNKAIVDMTGIEYFTSLRRLDCDFNKLTSLDVSKNTALEYLFCGSNQLTSLDVSKNTALIELLCANNQLTSLDVSENTKLNQLDCYKNKLTSLDVSRNTALTWLYCSNNELTSLDVSKNTALVRLWCHENQLTSLNASGATALISLFCEENQLTSLNVSGATALRRLDCDKNQLTSLDVSKNTKLNRLVCDKNQLTSLDVRTVPVIKDAVENGLLRIYNDFKSYDSLQRKISELMVEKTVDIITVGYIVTVTDDGNGTASASKGFGIAGEEITLTAEPKAGYKFKEWKVNSGGVTVTDNRFIIATEDVEQIIGL